MNEITRYYCPYDDGWFLDVRMNSLVTEIIGSPTQVLKIIRDKVEINLAAHLNEVHPGWTWEELTKMKEEK